MKSTSRREYVWILLEFFTELFQTVNILKRAATYIMHVYTHTYLYTCTQENYNMKMKVKTLLEVPIYMCTTAHQLSSTLITSFFTLICLDSLCLLCMCVRELEERVRVYACVSLSMCLSVCSDIDTRLIRNSLSNCTDRTEKHLFRK